MAPTKPQTSTENTRENNSNSTEAGFFLPKSTVQKIKEENGKNSK